MVSDPQLTIRNDRNKWRSGSGLEDQENYHGELLVELIEQVRTTESSIRSLRKHPDVPQGSREGPGGSNRTLAATSKGVFGEQRRQNLAKRTSV